MILLQSTEYKTFRLFHVIFQQTKHLVMYGTINGRSIILELRSSITASPFPQR
jgi:hypothetical protein